MTVIKDKYNGITINSSSIPTNEESFKNELQTVLNTYVNHNLLWITIYKEYSYHIDTLTKNGFQFHHCKPDYITLVKKLSSNPIIPTAVNHTLGVGAVVFDNTKLLVIKDRFNKGYKLPGGHIDESENITTALIREVYEETGITVEFDSIINLGHFTTGQFDESNLYILCKAKPKSKTINIIDSEEIMEAKWMEIDDFLHDDDVYPYNKAIIQSALKTTGIKLDISNIIPNKPNELFF